MANRYSVHIILFLLLSGIGLQPCICRAQNGLWDKPPKQEGKKTKSKIGKEASSIKKLGNHIKEWGLEHDYDKQFLIGGRLNSNGWSGGLYYFTRQKNGVYGFWQLHLSEIKHEKQIKLDPKGAYPELGKATPYIFGKINNLYTLQIGYGREHLLLPGVIDGNLSVSIRYNVGFSLAMLKPYYLQLIKIDNSQPNATPTLLREKYSDSTTDLFLSPQYIYGADKWSKGIGETKLVPGAYAELAFVIVPDPSKGFVEAITLGGNAAFYAHSLPVMANLKAHPYQVSLFAGLAMGKRWK